MSVDTLIIGAGIGGLSAGWHARKRAATMLILESAHRAGGSIRSGKDEGYLLEYGPNTVQLTSDINSIIEDIGLQGELLQADSKSTRYVQFNGKLHAVPTSPIKLIKTSLLSFGGKLRLIKEPFVPAKINPTEETLTEFSERRLGVEASERLIAPFVSGIWAGDADQLSAEAAFPRMVEWEREHGSLFRGALSGKSSSRGLMSFTHGMETLVIEMTRHMRESMRFGVSLTDIRPVENGTWRTNAQGMPIEAKEVILTVPAWEAARLVRSFAPEASATLNNIPYSPVAILHLGFDQRAIGRELDGFGFLTAPTENSDILGCIWSSSLFPGRAPEGKYLLTVFMGGARKRDIMNYPDGTLISKAVDALKPVMKLRNEPEFTRVTRYERAIPQYTVGHEDRIHVLRKTEKNFPGLHFQGNYRGGISVGDVIKNQFQKPA